MPPYLSIGQGSLKLLVSGRVLDPLAPRESLRAHMHSHAQPQAFPLIAYISGVRSQSLQTVEPIKDIASVVSERIDEESRSTPLAKGKLRLEVLAEILGGEGRNPIWIGKGWKDDLGGGQDAWDPKAVGKVLSAGARKNSRVFAWGFVIHVPKGVSLLSASDPEFREWFKEVREKMSREYMRVLEQGCVVRVGNGGYKDVPTKGLRAWWVGHAVSAGGDPHLHIHLIASATAEKPDGRLGQIDGRKLLRETARLADGSAKRVLAEELNKKGYGLGLDGELVGVDEELLEKASTAHNAIEAIQTYFASQGTPVSDERAWRHWRQIAAGKPDRSLPKNLIEDIRRSRGETLGGEEIEHLLDAALSDPQRARAVGAWLAKKYGSSNWNHLSAIARNAWAEYPRYDDVTSVIALMATLKTAPTPESVAGLCARFADDEARPELMATVARDPRILVGEKHWVLTSQLKREETLLERTTKLLAFTDHDATMEEALSDTDGAPLVVVQGVAGGGKTWALEAASREWDTKGVTVWATARNRLTATVTGLASGAERSRSLSAFSLRQRVALGGRFAPKPGDVVVVDEFGLLDQRDVEMILGLAESGVKVKALGDSHQIQPIDGSTSARLVMDLADECGMPTISETKRCAPWKDLHDSLRSVVTGETTLETIVSRLEIRSAQNVEEVAGIAGEYPGAEIAVRSNELRCKIADVIPRPEISCIAGSDKPNIAMVRDGIAAWKGDQIVVRQNSFGKDTYGDAARITNGERAVIQSVTPSELVLEIDDRIITVTREVAKNSLALGGVHTGDSAQGQSWERAVVVITGMETREWLYSASTRGKNPPVFVTLSQDPHDDPESVMEQVLRREGIARSVDEMCKTDAVLAQSVREHKGGDSSVSNLGSDGKADLSSDPKPQVPQQVAAEDAPMEASASAEAEESETKKPRKYAGGFFYKNDDGIWLVDHKQMEWVYREMGRRDPRLDVRLGTTRAALFNVLEVREIEPGSGEWYYPEAGTETLARLKAYRASLDQGSGDRHKGSLVHETAVRATALRKATAADTDTDTVPAARCRRCCGHGESLKIGYTKQ